MYQILSVSVHTWIHTTYGLVGYTQDVWSRYTALRQCESRTKIGEDRVPEKHTTLVFRAMVVAPRFILLKPFKPAAMPNGGLPLMVSPLT